MLKKSAWLVCLLLCLSLHALAQSAETKARELKELGRETIIEMAEKAIKKQHEEFSRENFDRIKVLVKTNSVYVSFAIPIRYVPMNSSAFYGVLYGLADPNGPMSSWDSVLTHQNLSIRKQYASSSPQRRQIRLSRSFWAPSTSMLDS